MGAQVSLFINVEPSVVGGAVPARVEALFRRAERKLRIVLELTERDLTRRPADLLRLVSWARERYWGVALDDVGAEPESLALLPFVEPDVVKLDMKLIQEDLTPDQEALVDAVQRYAGRTGASVLAEGIETEQHRDKALRLGANLAQGWLFGKPGSPAGAPATRAAVKLLSPPPQVKARSAFEILATKHQIERVTRAELLARTSKLEAKALAQNPSPVVLASFGSSGRFIPRAAGYADLAERCVLVGVLGTGTQPGPESRVRYTVLDERDPLAREWIVTVVGPTAAEVLAARSLGRDPHDVGDEVELIHTTDRDIVTSVAQLLLGRVLPMAGRISA